MSVDTGTSAGTGAHPRGGIERERAAARASGYAAGWASGAQAAHATARARLQEQTAAVEQARATELGRLHAARTALEAAAAQVVAASVPAVAQVSDAVLDAALQLAEAVLGHEALASSAPGRDALLRALRGERGAVDPVVRLHPADAATLQEGDVPAGVVVVADHALSRGDAVLQHASGSIEVLLRDALARARAELLP